MALFTERERHAYAQPSMPQPAFAHGPWGEAIRYWLQSKNMSPADLSRATGIQPNTISRARRGFHTTTRVLEKIADAFNVPIEHVLVSPERRSAHEERKRMIQEAVEAALRESERLPTSGGGNVSEQTKQSVLQDIHRLEESDRVGQKPTEKLAGKPYESKSSERGRLKKKKR